MSHADSDLQAAAALLRSARRLVVFTGAGVSAESGIDTFRDNGGLWREFAPEQFANWPGLLRTARREPHRCAAFIHRVFQPIADARPNAAHAAIARLEEFVATTVITQNVDRLHQDAGSTTVREIHGSLFEIVRMNGNRFVRLLSRRDMQQIARRLDAAAHGPLSLPRLALAIRPMAVLGLRGIIRPRAVLFGEALAEPDWENALADSRGCDVMLVVGTSGEVLPAAMLPSEARDAGAKVIVIDPTSAGPCDVWLRGTACEVLPELLESLADAV